MIDISTNNVIQEAYFGRRPEFETAEKLVDRIRNLIRTKKYTGTITDTKENKQLEEIFKKVFGFKEVHILWIDEVVPNAFTIMSSFVYKGSNESKTIIKDLKKGYYDTGHNDILFVAVYTGLLNQTDLTTEEFMGVILHEIGHNFDYSVYNTIYGLINRLTFSITPKIKNQIYDYYKHNSDFKAAHNYTEDVYKEFLDLREKIRIVDKAIDGAVHTLLLPAYIVCLPILSLSSLFFSIAGVVADKKKENFSDSFAAAYGYGAGCMSGLIKLNAYPKTLKNSNQFVKILNDISNCYQEFSLYLFECHGTTHERIDLSIMKLERDLKTGDFPPDMKKDLLKELERLKEIRKKMLSYNKEEYNHVSVTYRRIIEFLFKGTNIWHVMFPKNQV